MSWNGRTGGCISVYSSKCLMAFLLISHSMIPAHRHREGIVLSTITYNDHGEVRPLFYQLGLSEMIVPYGAPEHPHPRKFAFDA